MTILAKLLFILSALLLTGSQFDLNFAQEQKEPTECDAHICHCKGMQDADPYDENGDLKPSACKTRCKKNACCCPVPKPNSGTP